MAAEAIHGEHQLRFTTVGQIHGGLEQLWDEASEYAHVARWGSGVRQEWIESGLIAALSQDMERLRQVEAAPQYNCEETRTISEQYADHIVHEAQLGLATVEQVLATVRASRGLPASTETPSWANRVQLDAGLAVELLLEQLATDMELIYQNRKVRLNSVVLHDCVLLQVTS